MLSCVGLPTFGPKQVAVAGNVAVRDAVMLGPRDRETERERGKLSACHCPPPQLSTFPPHPPSRPLTSACLPGVNVFWQRWHLRQGRCQFLPKDINLSAGVGERWQFRGRAGSPARLLLSSVLCLVFGPHLEVLWGYFWICTQHCTPSSARVTQGCWE